MRVWKSANDEAKVQLAKLYFKVKINQEYPRKGKKDNAALNKTLIEKKNSDLRAIKRKFWLDKKFNHLQYDALVGISANNEAKPHPVIYYLGFKIKSNKTASMCQNIMQQSAKLWVIKKTMTYSLQVIKRKNRD